MKIIREGSVPNVCVIFMCEMCGTIYESSYKELLDLYGDVSLCECPNCSYINDSHAIQRGYGEACDFEDIDSEEDSSEE